MTVDPPPPADGASPPPSDEQEPTERLRDRRFALALVGGALALYLVLGQMLPAMAVAVFLLVQSGGALSPAALEEAMLPYLPLVLGFSAVLAGAGVALLARVGWLAPPPRERAPWPRLALWLLAGAAAALLGQIGIASLLEQLGTTAEEQEVVRQAAQQGSWALALAFVVAAPLGEELFFRRFLFGTLSRSHGRAVAYGASLLVFAAVHLNPSAFLLYLWMGLCFTVVYERTGSVWVAVGVHMANNGVAWLGT